MAEYKELIKALRCKRDDCDGCDLAFFDKDEGWMCQFAAKDDDAADAIEELDAEETRLLMITSELQDKVVELEEELNDADVAADDNAWQIEELEAEVKRLELDNEDYEHEHRRLKGEIEALQAQLPKRGKWIEDATTYAGPGLSNYKCSLCGKICGTWRRGLKHDELPNWCGNCGADMRKMEVQE